MYKLWRAGEHVFAASPPEKVMLTSAGSFTVPTSRLLCRAESTSEEMT